MLFAIDSIGYQQKIANSVNEDIDQITSPVLSTHSQEKVLSTLKAIHLVGSKNNVEMSVGDRGLTVRRAALAQNWHIVKFMLEGNREIPEEDRSLVLECAQAKKQQDVINSAKETGFKISVAAFTRDWKVVQEEGHKEMSVGDRGLTVRKAALAGEWHIVKFMLEGDREIPEEDRSMVLECAQAKEQQDVINFVGNYKPMSSKERGEKVSVAAFNRDWRFVELEGNKEMSVGDRGLTVRRAALAGEWHIVKSMLEGGREIPEEDRLLVLECAMKGKRQDVINLVGNYKPMSSIERGEKVSVAAFTCDWRFVELEGNKEMSPEYRGLTVRRAALAGRWDLVKFMLEGNRQISEEHREYTLDLASRAKNREMYFLLKWGK